MCTFCCDLFGDYTVTVDSVPEPEAIVEAALIKIRVHLKQYGFRMLLSKLNNMDFTASPTSGFEPGSIVQICEKKMNANHKNEPI